MLLLGFAVAPGLTGLDTLKMGYLVTYLDVVVTLQDAAIAHIYVSSIII